MGTLKPPALCKTLKTLKLGRMLFLLWFSLFLLEETASKKSYLVKTKDGKTYLTIGNPKDFTDGFSYFVNTSRETDTADYKSEYYPRLQTIKLTNERSRLQKKKRKRKKKQGGKITKKQRNGRTKVSEPYSPDYADNDNGWLNPCSLKKNGRRVQKDVRGGCGGWVKLKCTGGCLKVHMLVYDCKMTASANPDQLRVVANNCDGKEECTIVPENNADGSAGSLGQYSTCQTKESRKLWLTYSCSGGEDLTTIYNPPTCSSNTCDSNQVGIPKQVDVYGHCGGFIRLACTGGCLKIDLVAFDCEMGSGSNPSQLRLVKELCEGKENCKIIPSQILAQHANCQKVEERKT